MTPSERQKLMDLDRRVRAVEGLTVAAPLAMAKTAGVPMIYMGAAKAAAAVVAGFYASLSGTTSPYSFAEVVGPAVGSAAVTGGRTGTANATEVLTGLAAIPAGTIVWMTAGGATAYQFACVKIVYVTGWQINTGTPCTITPTSTTTYYLSTPNLCARAV